MNNHGYKYVFFRICINIFWTAIAARSFDFVMWHVFFSWFWSVICMSTGDFEVFFRRGARLSWASDTWGCRIFSHPVGRIMFQHRIKEQTRFTRRDILSARREPRHLKHFQSKYFETCFWTNNSLFLKKQQLIFEHTGLTTIETQNVCVLCAHTIMFGLPNGSMLDHDKTPQLIFFWAKLASRVPSDEARQISHDWDPVIWNLWHYLFLAALVFEQPICETQLFDTWVHAACMVWSALIFLSWWKETVWI